MLLLIVLAKQVFAAQPDFQVKDPLFRRKRRTGKKLAHGPSSDMARIAKCLPSTQGEERVRVR